MLASAKNRNNLNTKVRFKENPWTNAGIYVSKISHRIVKTKFEHRSSLEKKTNIAARI